MDVTVVGLPELAQKLRVLGDRMADAIMAAVTAGAMVIQNEAKALAPVRSGTLRRSIVIEKIDKSSSGATVAIGPSEPYGKYIEFGTGVYAEGGGGRQTPWTFQAGDGSWVTTRGMKPKPFMRPAYDSKRTEALKEIEATLRIVAEKAAQ